MPQKLEKYGTPQLTVDEVAFDEKAGLSKGEKTAANKLKKRWFEGMVATYSGGGAGYRLEEREQLEAIIGNKFIDAFTDLFNYCISSEDKTNPKDIAESMLFKHMISY